MEEWMRNLWHPTYGFYGGRDRKCRGEVCPLPIDEMDRFFCQHDLDLWEAKQVEDARKRRDLILQADLRLARGLRRLSWRTSFKWPIYGHLYRLGSMVVFRP